MADKGFDIKVLIPTDDGLTISENGIEQARYYLTYNLSNRSYQLADKVKTSDFYLDSVFDLLKFTELVTLNKIDLILTVNPEHNLNLSIKILPVLETDIGKNLIQIIDQIDKKELK